MRGGARALCTEDLEEVEVLAHLGGVDLFDQLVDQLPQLRLPAVRDQRLAPHDLVDKYLDIRLRRELEEVDGLIADLAATRGAQPSGLSAGTGLASAR